MNKHSLGELKKQCKAGAEQGLVYFTVYMCRS